MTIARLSTLAVFARAKAAKHFPMFNYIVKDKREIFERKEIATHK